MEDKNTLLQHTNQELFVRIRENKDDLKEIYQQCKVYCLNFMRSRNTGTISIDDEELNDIYQDAILVFYEKIIKGSFELTSNVQTYLNSICKNQLLNKVKNKKKYTSNEGFENLDFNKTINDALEPLDYEKDEKDEKFDSIKRALMKMKESGGRCYELLTLFWYNRMSMNQLTIQFGYSNEETTKNQKAKCQKRLKKIAFNELNN